MLQCNPFRLNRITACSCGLSYISFKAFIAALLTFSFCIEAGQNTKVSRVALSQEAIDSFNNDGYVIVRNLFSPQEILEIKTCFVEAFHQAKAIAIQTQIDEKTEVGASFRCLYEGEQGRSASVKAIAQCDGSTSVQLISWIGGVKPKLIDLARQDKVTVPVSQLLLSSSADHLINQVHYKMPFDQVVFSWHQDIQNRRRFDPDWEDLNGKGSFVQVLTAIDKVTLENGPLIVIKGSHKRDLYLEGKTQEEVRCVILQEYPNHEWTPILMDPGDTLFMHPLILHKSDANCSCHSRMMFINGFSYPGANKRAYPGSGSAETISLQ